MKRFSALVRCLPLCLASCLALVACGRAIPDAPPPLTPLSPVPAPLTCSDFFPQGDWQYVHALRFTPKSGFFGADSASAVSIVVLRGRELRLALTTVEGLTLFEARSVQGEAPEVARALPPFDRPAFADNFVRDLRLLLLPPLGLVHQGQLAGQFRVCRYEGANNTVIDLMETNDGCWRRHIYHRDPAQNRTVRAWSCEYTAESGLMPAQLELQAPFYTLNLRLISAQRPDGPEEAGP